MSIEMKQEPVAWIVDYEVEKQLSWYRPKNSPSTPLYTTPPAAQRQWVGLSDDEIIQCTPTWGGTVEDVARAIEAKLREKNGGQA